MLHLSASPAVFDCLRYLKTPRHCGGFCRVHFWAGRKTWVLGWAGSCRTEFLAHLDVCEFCWNCHPNKGSPKCSGSISRGQTTSSAGPFSASQTLLPPVISSSQLAERILPCSIFLVCSVGFSRGSWKIVVLWRESYGEVAESDKSQGVGCLSCLLSKDCSAPGQELGEGRWKCPGAG